MQELVYAGLMPHPPLLIPEVGGDMLEQVAATRDAMRRFTREVAAQAPEVVVIISPHGPVFQDAIAVHAVPELAGDFAAFGAPHRELSAAVAMNMARKVEAEAGQEDIPVALVTPEWAEEWEAERLDHGTAVPLFYLQEAGWSGEILPVSIGMLPTVRLYAFGKALQRVIDTSGRKVAVIASGDLSHRLTPDAPAGYRPGAEQFDRQVVQALAAGDMGALFRLDPDLCDRAGECGLRPLQILAGVLDGVALQPEVLTYEGPFGVGYAVAPLRPMGPDPNRRLLHVLERERAEGIARRRESAHPVVKLARTALEHFVETGLELDFSAGAPHEGAVDWQLPEGLPERAGVFVSLKVDGALRGCMGSTEPHEPTLALEIVKNAIAAAVRDPRFGPVEEEELTDLDYSVDVLHPPEPCGLADLDPKRYGVLVVKGEERGLLLPDLSGVDTVNEQVDIACRKAGLSPDDPELQLFRFQVDRYI